MTCENCGGSGEVSVSVPCPGRKGAKALKIHDSAGEMFALLQEWAALLYEKPLRDHTSLKLSGLAFRTGKCLGAITKEG